MLNNEGQAATVTKGLDPVSAANTAAGSSGWIDCRGEGDVVCIVSVGAVTGTLTPSFEQATSGAGAGNVAILPNEALAALTANTVTRYTFRANGHLGWLKFIGTIVTGPSLISVVFMRRPKYI